MIEMTWAEPEAIGWDPERLAHVGELLAQATRTGEAPAAAFCVGGRGGIAAPRSFGLQHPDRPNPLRDDALFLVASLTKPLTALAAMLLVEAGALTLDDRVVDLIPEFQGDGKSEVRLRHLLTHTSGLPDQLPENQRLRAAHAPLSAFVEGTCRHPLLFPAGTGVQYQSMGFTLLAEIVQRATGTAMAAWLRDRVFEPIGMADTYLGCPSEVLDRVAVVRVPPDQPQGADWGWNSPYWLGFGAPWGGLATTPSDFAKFCRMMLNQGEANGRWVVAPATVRTMTVNQLQGMPGVPEDDRRCRPRGLGWRLAWPGSSANFGDLLGPRAYGHWGATGTLCWLDPDAQAFCLLFTTTPAVGGRFLARISNALAAALVDGRTIFSPGSESDQAFQE